MLKIYTYVITIYTYIEMGLFKDWGITNTTLKRKVKRRLPKKQLKKRKEPQNYDGRTYTSNWLGWLKIVNFLQPSSPF